ncbi:hypothetical protein PPERSA_00239 [Pseudocohnilembus persalinus]|uniref:Uncharacterized protein n=1 Tax=Pseudocohnilembus persalinus TaxID=266149 RepID=A0A0V0Q905_PSEPJ|nr:hypothetical protein PPERSA_00239 [Pseudocohnilembus persalinus]|eukprot:KRW98651.1 hypothetical protein PPERSA_00239 [Pseudocohnilembus persalinus]
MLIDLIKSQKQSEIHLSSKKPYNLNQDENKVISEQSQESQQNKSVSTDPKKNDRSHSNNQHQQGSFAKSQGASLSLTNQSKNKSNNKQSFQNQQQKSLQQQNLKQQQSYQKKRQNSQQNSFNVNDERNQSEIKDILHSDYRILSPLNSQRNLINIQTKQN